MIIERIKQAEGECQLQQIQLIAALGTCAGKYWGNCFAGITGSGRKMKHKSVKGFIDVYKNIYTILSDTKIVSKILEIHVFPQIIQFAEEKQYFKTLPA
jgi:hypothetical protein